MRCSEKNCRKRRAKNRTVCHSCKYRRWAKRHPIRACYITLKANAKRRGKEFTLTFSEFCKFAIRSKLFHSRGRTSESYSVDRINNECGYTASNIQVLTLSENSLKSIRERRVKYDYQTKYGCIEEMPADTNEYEF